MSKIEIERSETAAEPRKATFPADPPEMRSEPDKKKDAWDKAQIVSGFISSVVIAGVGILINMSIQQAQITASEANTKAQIAVTDKNNQAQMALTERNAQI